jgi:hypothetical protein
MLNQHSYLINKLESFMNDISYVVTLNLMGEITSELRRGPDEKDADTKVIMSNIGRIITATSLLNFDNVKFLMYEENNRKVIIVNIHESSLVIGLNKYATESNAIRILGEVLNQVALGRID